MLNTCGTKGPVMTVKQTPWMRPYNIYRYIISKPPSVKSYFKFSENKWLSASG